MNVKNLLLTTTLATFTGFYALTGVADEDDIRVEKVTTWMPMSQAISQVEAQGISNISEVERKRNVYKVEAINAEGKKTVILIHGETGDVVKQWTKGDKKDRKHKRQHHDD